MYNISKKNISDDLRKKLANCISDVEFAKTLADNGVDVEEFEKSLPDEILSKIVGGYEDLYGDNVYCPWCNNDNSDEISFQVFTSISTFASTYRCRKCDNYFRKGSEDGETIIMVKVKK